MSLLRMHCLGCFLNESCRSSGIFQSSPWNFIYWFNGVWFNDVVSFLKHFCHFCDMLFFPKKSTSSVVEPTVSCPVHVFGNWTFKNPVFAIFITQGLAQKGHEESLRLLKLRLGGPLGFVPWRILMGHTIQIYIVWVWSWFGVIHGFYPIFFWMMPYMLTFKFTCSPKWLQPDGALHLAGSKRFEGPYSPKSPF